MAKLKPADIRLYTDGSYYQKTSALGSAWVRATKDGELKKRGYCINSPDNNKSGSLLTEIIAVSEGLRQLSADMGNSKVTVYTDCRDVMLAIVDRDYAYRAGKTKNADLANAWRDLDEQSQNHEVSAIWIKHDNEPHLLEAHEIAQLSANYKMNNDGTMIYHVDIEEFDLDALQ